MASICKRLNKSLGGKWTYDFGGIWLCDDGLRYITRNCSSSAFWATTDEEAASYPPEYWLRYFRTSGEWKPPERAEKYFTTRAKSPLDV